MNWELAVQLILALVAASGAIGSVYAIRRQLKMEKLEQKKLVGEAESLSAEVAAKLIDSAGDLQEFYGKLFEELRKQLDDQNVVICRLEVKIEEQITKIEEQITKIEEQTTKIEEQTTKIEEQNIKIEGLCEQVRELGQEPRHTREK